MPQKLHRFLPGMILLLFAALSASAAPVDAESARKSVVNGPGELSFDWMVSSEKNYDFLEFSIDGTVQEKISGTVSWATKTFRIDEGEHMLLWTYLKDYSTSKNDDAGYVDHIVWTPAPSYEIETPIFVTATRVTFAAGQTTGTQYTGFLTKKGCEYAWGKDGEAKTDWKLSDGTPMELPKPEGDGWELMVKE